MKVVIVGGGFGGVYAAKYLIKHADVCLISENNYFLFTPLLHEVATGGLHQNLVVQPLSQLFKSKRFITIKARATSIDSKHKLVVTDQGEFPYDYLILATGSSARIETSGAKEHAIPLKEMQDAKRIRNVLIERLEEASHASRTKRRELLTFAVVGGGPTGVELIAEIAEFLHLNAQRYYPKVCRSDLNINLYQHSDRLLSQLRPYFQRRVEKQLKKLGVHIHYNSNITKVDQKGVYLGKKLHKASAVFWTAGVRPNTIPINTKDFVMGYPVDQFLRVENQPYIFAVGDCAHYVDPFTKRRAPMLAQIATQQGPVVAKNIRLAIQRKPLKPFTPRLKGFLVSVGQWFAVASIRSWIFSGRFAWWVWRTIYLTKLIGFQNKVKVAVDWTLNLFFPRDVSQLD